MSRGAPALAAALLLAAPAMVSAQASRQASVQAVDARVPDTWARRAAACTACHHGDGAASADGYVPRIAGKPAGYLLRQLQNFRDGQRRHDAMARLLENQDDATLAGLAAHFARQTPPYPAPSSPPQAAAVQRARAWMLQGDAARGVPACASCHGASLTGTAPQVPGLLGLPAGYLAAQLGAWRSGLRSGPAPDCMATIARALPAQAIAEISGWLAAQPVPAGPAAAPATPPASWPMACGALQP